jgi:hypothetical protein
MSELLGRLDSLFFENLTAARLARSLYYYCKNQTLVILFAKYQCSDWSFGLLWSSAQTVNLCCAG